MTNRIFVLALLAPAVFLVALDACSSDSSDDPGSNDPSAAAGDGAAGSADDATGGDGAPGSSSGPLAMQTSGTRLRRRLLGAVGSSDRAFVDWFDTARNETCAFRRSTLRPDICVPGFGGALLYSDPTCLHFFGGFATGSCAQPYLEGMDHPDPDAGAVAWGLHPVEGPLDGGPKPGPQARGYAIQSLGSIPGVCQFQVLYNYDRYVSVGPSIREDAFVATKISNTQRELVTAVAVGQDGSRSVVGWSLPAPGGAVGAACTVQRYKDGSLRCIDTARPTPLFADQTCSGAPIAYAAPANQPWVVAPTVTSCGQPAVVVHRTVPATVDASPVYQAAYGGCYAFNTAGSKLFTFGDELPANTFTEAREQLVGSGPVQAVSRTLDGYASVVGFQDSVHEVPCTFMPDSEGKLRCTPTARQTASYLDAACTQPTSAFFDFGPSQCSGPAPVAPIIARLDTTACTDPKVLNVYKATAATTATFDKLPDGTCVPAQTPRYTVTDTEVPLTDLSEGDIQTE